MTKGSVAPVWMVRLAITMNTPSTMKAVQLNRFGAPDVLELIELPIPVNREMLVNVSSVHEES